ncbi:MAG TPA: energy transducer TonB [Tepidisphaeraceae bacterium]|jgi:TonB family protein|nr:energy transducer TonB [Tepidisphaeraceae bacterium]
MNERNLTRLLSAAVQGGPGSPDDFPTMTQLATLTIWVFFASVGVIGVIWQNPLFHADRAAPPATPMTIDVTTQAPSPPDAGPSLSIRQPAPADPQPALPAAPPAVAAPAPDIAFAIPTPDVPRIVAPAVAAPIARPAPAVHPTANARPTGPPPAPAAVHRLVLGQGEGQYIQISYPEEAQIAGEEGTVDVQFTQDDAGHVIEAHLATPSRWPILNAAALRAIRQTRFPPGHADTHLISIEFKLQ